MSSFVQQAFYSNLSGRQQDIIRLLAIYQKGISTTNMQQKIAGINSATTLKRELRLLKANNLIYSSGSGKNIVWLLKEQSDENML